MNHYRLSMLRQIRHFSRRCHERNYHCSSQYFNNPLVAHKPIFIKPTICQQLTCNLNTKPKADVENDNFFKSFLKKVGWKDYSKARLRLRSYLIYEAIVDEINYAEWFAHFKFSDTFFSWFLVTELHIWMIMIKCMGEGQEGRILRNFMVETLWADASIRAKKVEHTTSKLVRENIDLLSEQFQAALIGYDEGLLTNDVILASAVWRRFFAKENDDAELIEDVVHYIRYHIDMLEKVPRENFLRDSKIVWTPLHKMKK